MCVTGSLELVEFAVPVAPVTNVLEVVDAAAKVDAATVKSWAMTEAAKINATQTWRNMVIEGLLQRLCEVLN